MWSTKPRIAYIRKIAALKTTSLSASRRRLFPIFSIFHDNWVISEKEIEKRRFLVHAEREHDQRGCDIRRPRGFSAIFQHDRQGQYAAEHRRAVRRNRNQAAREHQGDGSCDHHAAKSNLATLLSAAGTILPAIIQSLFFLQNCFPL